MSTELGLVLSYEEWVSTGPGTDQCYIEEYLRSFESHLNTSCQNRVKHDEFAKP